jgi:hypothetical protein
MERNDLSKSNWYQIQRGTRLNEGQRCLHQTFDKASIVHDVLMKDLECKSVFRGYNMT